MTHIYFSFPCLRNSDIILYFYLYTFKIAQSPIDTVTEGALSTFGVKGEECIGRQTAKHVPGSIPLNICLTNISQGLSHTTVSYVSIALINSCLS